MSWPEAFAVGSACIAIVAIFIGLFWLIVNSEEVPRRPPVIQDSPMFTHIHYKGPANTAPKWVFAPMDDESLKDIAKELAKIEAEKSQEGVEK